MMPSVKKISADTTSGNTWTNRTPWLTSRTGINGSIPISTPIHSGIRETSIPDSSDSIVTRISVVTIDNITDPPTEAIWSPGVGNKRQYTTPYFRDSDKLDTSIDGNFTNKLVDPPIFTDVVRDKLSNDSIRDIYAFVGMHLAADPINSVTPHFVDLGFSTVDALDKGAGLWTPTTVVLGSADVAHWSAPDHIFG